ncbi:hypothetical protein [Dokdonella sp.]|uniref:hypothetical protein n=1 Tax=Dokdonella sp. TaxID=2291710 RepID=UPI0035292C64
MNSNFLMGLVLCTGLLMTSLSSACNVPPFNQNWIVRGAADWTQTGTDCELRASVSAGSPAAATAHYRRANRTAPLRLSFILSPSPALISIDGSQIANLATGTALSVPAQGPAQASLFNIKLTGDSTSFQPQLRFEAACAPPAGLNGICSAQVPVGFGDFPLRITLQLEMGDADAGRLQAWLGDDTSGTPTVSIADLDNSRWQGIDRVSLGLSGVSASLASVIGMQPFSFSEIEVNEAQLFWSDFETDLAGNILATGQAISTTGPIQGNTCLGTPQFPTIASGSTQLDGLAIVHTLDLGSSAQLSLDLIPSVPGMRMFVCPAGSGPSGPCIDASAELLPVYLANPTAGSYQVVVGNVEQSCGSYNIAVTGSLN